MRDDSEERGGVKTRWNCSPLVSPSRRRFLSFFFSFLVFFLGGLVGVCSRARSCWFFFSRLESKLPSRGCGGWAFFNMEMGKGRPPSAASPMDG